MATLPDFLASPLSMTASETVNLTLEMRLLGTLLLHSDTQGAADLTGYEFISPVHTEIYSWMTVEREAKRASDFEAFQTLLKGNGEGIEKTFRASAVDLLSWLKEAADDAWPPDRVTKWIREIRNAGGRRKLRTVFEQGKTDLAAGKPIEEVTDDAIEGIFTARGVVGSPSQLIKDIDIVGDLVRIAEGSAYVQTAIPDIDEDPDIGGICAEGVTLILARSSMGKTSMINRIALGAAALGTPVYLHGTETSRERRKLDLACSVAGFTVQEFAMVSKLRDKSHPHMLNYKAAVEAIAAASKWIDALPLHISGSGITVDEVAKTALGLRHKGDLGHPGQRALMLVDYLQNMPPSNRRGLRIGDRVAQVGHSSMTLANLSAHKDMRIPIILAAQVSGEKDDSLIQANAIDPRPAMFDCQWSSQAHQDAEEVVYLHRGDYFREMWGDKYKPKYNPGGEGVIELGFRKRRSGRKPRVELEFYGPAKWVSTHIEGMPPQWQSNGAN